MTTEARKKANKRYDDNNTVQFKMKLNKNTDKDILERLDNVESKQTYIKRLIREDMHREAEG